MGWGRREGERAASDSAARWLAAKGLKTSPAFGTCSDLIYPSFDAKAGVTVTMVGFAGPFDSAAAQKKAGMSKAVYRWDGRGTLMENGRVVR